jgi:fluoride ion exporter CrcB/FEX
MLVRDIVLAIHYSTIAQPPETWTMNALLIVALSGGIGSVGRYLLSGVAAAYVFLSVLVGMLVLWAGFTAALRSPA